MRHEFDPNRVSRKDMERLADAIDAYIEEFLSIMIIPDEIADKHGKDIEEGIRRAKKFTKALRKGNMDCFKDEDEWNVIA